MDRNCQYCIPQTMATSVFGSTTHNDNVPSETMNAIVTLGDANRFADQHQSRPPRECVGMVMLPSDKEMKVMVGRLLLDGPAAGQHDCFNSVVAKFEGQAPQCFFAGMRCRGKVPFLDNPYYDLASDSLSPTIVPTAVLNYHKKFETLLIACAAQMHKVKVQDCIGYMYAARADFYNNMAGFVQARAANWRRDRRLLTDEN